MRKYNLVSLSNISQTIKAVLNILDEAGITAQSQPDVYDQIYAPYQEKLNVVNAEITVRENEVKFLDRFVKKINEQQKIINNALDLEAYLGSTLWLELLAFRREEEQENRTLE